MIPYRTFVLVALVAVWAPTTSKAQAPGASLGELANQGHSVTAVTPVYNQLVMFSYPRGFKPAFAKDSGPNYIQEYVLEGETVEKWTQMVTLTGAKGLAANQAVTPQRVVESIAAGFQRACPASFAALPFGALEVSGHEAFVALFGCGTVPVGPARSEVAMVLAVRGAADYYTIQWAERAEPSSQRPVLDGGKWVGRLRALNPIKVCGRVPNEPAPYPSCINQK
jgi:hypothetical protein